MRLIKRFSRSTVALGAVCLALALFSGAWLAWADDRLLDQIPKRLAQGRSLRLEHHMALGFHRAAWAGLLVGLAGTATMGLWGERRGGAKRTADPAAANDPATTCGVPRPAEEQSVLPDGWMRPVCWRTVVAVAVVAMSVSGALRWPRLGHSFWSDEAYAARAYVWGLKSPQPDGTLAFKPVSWTEAAFLNERANNQVWCSIEARVAHRIWQTITMAPADTFRERVLRMPAFLWGLATVGVVTVLGAMLAGRWGTAAGLLLAAHPWHVRFAAEMRGYSAMLLALALGIVFLALALRDGRWRWWLLGAAANLWALLAFAGSAHVPLLLCGVAAGRLVWKRRWGWLARLGLANALAAVAFLWIYGPSITQLKDFLARGSETAAYTVSLGWLRQFGEALCLGVPWSVMGPAWHEASWIPSATAASAAVAAIALLFAARVALAAKYRARLLLLPGLLAGAAALSILQSVVAGTILLMWYLLPAGIGWVLVLGTTPEPRDVPGRRMAPAVFAGLHAGAIAVCLAVWTGVSVAMSSVPRQPMREAAQVAAGLAPVPRQPTREAPVPRQPMREAISAGGEAERRVRAVLGISDGQMKLYAPDVITVKTLADFEQAATQAATAGAKLWISVGGWEATEARTPELTARLTGGAYEKVADLPGWEPMFSYQVWRQR